jgi:hypothetical protein
MRTKFLFGNLLNNGQLEDRGDGKKMAEIGREDGRFMDLAQDCVQWRCRNFRFY